MKAGSKKKGRLSPFAVAFKVVTLGKARFEQPGRYTLSVKALEIDAQAIEYDQGLMLLREVILRPV